MAAKVSVSVPIWLTLIRMELATPCSMPSLEDLRIGDEQVVADDLDVLAEPLGEQLPAVPVVLGHAVFDADDRVLVDQVAQIVDHAGGGRAPASRPPGCTCRPCRTRKRRRSRPSTTSCARHVAGRLDGLAGSVRWPRRCPRRWARNRLRRRPWSDSPCLSSSFFRAWNTSAPQRSASRKLLAPTGTIMNSWMSRLLLACAPPLMTFIIGTGICIAPAAAEVAIQRQAGFFGRGLGHRHRHGQHGVGAQARLVFGAVEFDHASCR